MGGSPLSSRWHSFSPPLVTGAPAAHWVARQCRMPQAPSALATACFSLPSYWKYSQVHRHTSSRLLWRSTPSLHPQLLTTQKSRRDADGKGWGREKSPLDVGNKSDRAHWIRPGIIFLIDFMLKGVCMFYIYIKPFFFSYFARSPLLLNPSFLLLYSSRDNTIIYIYVLKMINFAFVAQDALPLLENSLFCRNNKGNVFKFECTWSET